MSGRGQCWKLKSDGMDNGGHCGEEMMAVGEIGKGREPDGFSILCGGMCGQMVSGCGR